MLRRGSPGLRGLVGGARGLWDDASSSGPEVNRGIIAQPLSAVKAYVYVVCTYECMYSGSERTMLQTRAEEHRLLNE